MTFDRNSLALTNDDDLKADDALLTPFREKLQELLTHSPSSNTLMDQDEIKSLAESEDDMRRFLVARNNDLDTAFAMAQADLEWRSKFRPDRLTPADFATANAQGVWRFAGTTKEGWTILHITARNWSSWAYSVDEYVKMVAYHVERTKTKNLIIFDMAKMGYFVDMRKMRQLAHIMSDYYPERLGCAVFCNCNWVFDKLFHIAIKWVDQRTEDKVVDFRDNGAEFLLQHIDADQLTTDLGGTREEPWPLESLET